MPQLDLTFDNYLPYSFSDKDLTDTFPKNQEIQLRNLAKLDLMRAIIAEANGTLDHYQFMVDLLDLSLNDLTKLEKNPNDTFRNPFLELKSSYITRITEINKKLGTANAILDLSKELMELGPISNYQMMLSAGPLYCQDYAKLVRGYNGLATSANKHAATMRQQCQKEFQQVALTFGILAAAMFFTALPIYLTASYGLPGAQTAGDTVAKCVLFPLACAALSIGVIAAPDEPQTRKLRLKAAESLALSAQRARPGLDRLGNSALNLLLLGNKAAENTANVAAQTITPALEKLNDKLEQAVIAGSGAKPALIEDKNAAERKQKRPNNRFA